MKSFDENLNERDRQAVERMRRAVRRERIEEAVLAPLSYALIAVAVWLFAVAF